MFVFALLLALQTLPLLPYLSIPLPAEPVHTTLYHYGLAIT